MSVAHQEQSATQQQERVFRGTSMHVDINSHTLRNSSGQNFYIEGGSVYESQASLGGGSTLPNIVVAPNKSLPVRNRHLAKHLLMQHRQRGGPAKAATRQHAINMKLLEETGTKHIYDDEQRAKERKRREKDPPLLLFACYEQIKADISKKKKRSALGAWKAAQL